MKKQTFLLSVLYLLLILNAHSQSLTEDQRCGTEKNHQILTQKYPGQVLPQQEFEDWIAKEIKKRTSKNAITGKGNPLITMPIVFHIIHSGQPVGTGANLAKTYVDAQLQQLNNDFRKIAGTSGDNTHPAGADSELEFCPAAIDPNGNVLTEPGINRVDGPAAGFGNPPYGGNMDGTIKPATIWDPNLYVNVWVADLGGGLLGYAQFPSSSGLPGMPGNGGPANTDGVVVVYTSVGSSTLPYPGGAPYNLGRTLTHELGHFFGLRHIWGDSTCGDDFCADTPQSLGSNFGCPNQTTCDGIVDMVQNYMDYSDDPCMNIYTQDQKTRMQTVMALSPRRASLATSNACSTTPAPPTANFLAANTTSCTIPFTVQFQDLSGGFPSVTGWNWSFPGGTPATSTMQNPTVTYNATGTYDVSLVVTNSVGADTIVEVGYINVNTVPVGVPNPLVEDFQTVVFPPVGWSIDNPDNSYTWERTTAAGYNSSSSMYMNYWNYTANGPVDDMKLPGVNCSNITNTQLTFDLAYALYSYVGGGFSDTLEILVSVDCGATYTSVYKKFEATLITAPNHSTEFFPLQSEWRQETINLGAYDGESNLEVIFRATSDYENNLFVDNINISGTAPSAPPVAGFNFSSSTSGCQLEVVQFTDNSMNGPTSWNWTFTGGSPATSTLQNPVITYNMPGTYDATLVATNNLGTDMVTQTAIVTVDPAMVTTIASTDLLCNGDANGTASVTANGTNPINYTWSNGGNTASVNMLNGGMYMVTVTDDNNCVNVETVNINEPTLIAVTGTTTSSNCGMNNGTIMVSATGGTPGYQYLWNTGQTTPMLSGLTSGMYTISVTDNNGCTVVSSFTITGMSITVTAMDETCAGSNNGTATATSNNGTGPFTYLWNDGQTTGTASGLAPGTYTVMITDANGCVGTESTTIVAGQVAVLSTTTTDVSCGLIDDGTAVATLSGGVQPITYTWSNGTVSQGVAGLNIGTYTVTATDALGCTATGSVTINDPNINADVMPSQVVINLAVNPTVQFTDNSVGATSWMWDFGDGTTSTMQNPSHTYTAIGTYTVTVTVSNGQCSDTQVITITVVDTSTGFDDWTGLTSFELYPNPTTGKFTLELSLSQSSDLMVSVINPLGQEVISDQQDGVLNDFNKEYDLSRFANGVYFVQVTNGDQSIVKKMFYLK